MIYVEIVFCYNFTAWEGRMTVLCRVPNCPKCDTGILKPYVVFFGDNVPKPRVEFVRKQVEESDALLVVGSSLFVFSGYRFNITFSRSRF